MDLVAKALLMAHAATSVAVAGAATHNGILSAKHLFGRPVRAKLRRVYPQVLLWLYAANMAVGTLLYPAFRVKVRAEWMDTHFPLGTALFEVKEHLATLGLFALLALYPLGRRLDLKTRRWDVLLHDSLAILVMLVIWYLTMAGFFLVSVRSV